VWISTVRASDTERSVDFGALIFPILGVLSGAQGTGARSCQGDPAVLAFALR